MLSLLPLTYLGGDNQEKFELQKFNKVLSLEIIEATKVYIKMKQVKFQQFRGFHIIHKLNKHCFYIESTHIVCKSSVNKNRLLSYRFFI